MGLHIQCVVGVTFGSKSLHYNKVSSNSKSVQQPSCFIFFVESKTCPIIIPVCKPTNT